MSKRLSTLSLLALCLLLGAASAHAARRPSWLQLQLRSLLANPDHGNTQGDAWASTAGAEPGGPGDAFTWQHAETSSTSNYNGVYYATGKVTVMAGDKAKGGWSGAYSKSPQGDRVAISDNFDSEYSTQRGVTAISGTYEGARAVSGSGGMYGAAKGGVITDTMDSYGPTPDGKTLVGGRRKSVAFTNIAPNSAAQAGWGNGPAAIASGYEVSAAARAARDKKPDPVTVMHRDASDKLQGSLMGRRHRRHLLTWGAAPPGRALLQEALLQGRRLRMH